MGVKKINGGVEDFINRFVRARGGDSTGTDAATPASTQYTEATGGIISDYSDGPAVYRAHIFTSSGTFDVTQIGNGVGGAPAAVAASVPVESPPRALTNLLIKSSTPFIFLTPMITHPCRR